MVQLFTMFGTSFALVMFLMIVLWVVYLFKRNAGIVDIGWKIGFLITAWACFILGNGAFLKSLIFTVMVTVWAGRLTSHLYQRYMTTTKEDPRYTSLRAEWGGKALVYFLAMFIFQGVLIVILSLPLFIVAEWSKRSWSNWEMFGVIVWAVAVVGESVADSQLSAFKMDEGNKGKVCQSGLWRLIRHPNYFFELLVWVAFFLFAYPTDWGFFAVLSPVIMGVLLLNVSGINLTEGQSLKSRVEACRTCQKATNRIILWFPKLDLQNF